MTNDVTITRNIFGPKLSPDGLDWLTMAKWKKYTGAWPAMVEKLRYIRYGFFWFGGSSPLTLRGGLPWDQC
jgi:hypothetical protein